MDAPAWARLGRCVRRDGVRVFDFGDLLQHPDRRLLPQLVSEDDASRMAQRNGIQQLIDATADDENGDVPTPDTAHCGDGHVTSVKTHNFNRHQPLPCQHERAVRNHSLGCAASHSRHKGAHVGLAPHVRAQ